MKTILLTIAAWAFTFGIDKTFANSNLLLNTAKGIALDGKCNVSQLNGYRTYGPGSGECYTEDHGNGVCTVTFPFSTPTAAFQVSGICLPWEMLFIQD
jgi:hypothetical protein